MRGVTIFALVGLLLGACAPAVPQQQATSLPGTVTIRMTGDWPGLDPNPAPGNGACNIPCSTVVYPLYDRLVATGPDPKNPGQIAILPYLATSWTATPTKVSFNLRKDATCSDGTPVTASIVKRSFERILGGGRNVATYGGGPFSMDADDAAGTFTLNLQTPFNDAI